MGSASDMRPIYASWLMALLLAACREPSPVPTASDGTARCAAALGFIELELAGRRSDVPVVIDTDFGSETAGLDLPTLAAVRRELGPAAPRLPLLREMATTKESAATGCPALAAFLESRGIAFGRAAAGDIEQAGGDPFRADIIGVSLPVLSVDRRDALLIARFAGGGDRVTGTAYHLQRRHDGAWTIAGLTPLWFRIGPELRVPATEN